MELEVIKIKELFFDSRRIDKHQGTWVLFKNAKRFRSLQGILDCEPPFGIIPLDGTYHYLLDRQYVKKLFYSSQDNLVGLIFKEKGWKGKPKNKNPEVIIFKLEVGQMESQDNELAFLLKFVPKFLPDVKPELMWNVSDVKKILLNNVHSKELAEEIFTNLYATVKPSKWMIHRHMKDGPFQEMTFYRDFARSYVNFINQNQMSKKQYVKFMRGLDNIPAFVKTTLNWSKPSMLLDAMVFFIFKQRCANYTCFKFTNLKCSRCKMVNYCGRKCQRIGHEVQNHKAECTYIQRHDVVYFRRLFPSIITRDLRSIHQKKDIVSMETFLRELFRKICEQFMEPLQGTKLMLDTLNERNLKAGYRMVDIDKKGEVMEVVGNPKYLFDKGFFHLLIKNKKAKYKPKDMKSLLQQMEDVYGPFNFLSLAVGKQIKIYKDSGIAEDDIDWSATSYNYQLCS